MTDTNVKQEEEVLTKEDLIVRYAKTLDELDRAMEPFREHKKDLKQSYIENGWLTKEEMSLILKAYRMMKKEEDLGEIQHYVDMIKKGL
jgi:DNA-directed RNA polymerase subunit F